MRITTALLGTLAAAGLCTSAQARVIDTSADYTNPETVPFLLKYPSITGADCYGYYDVGNSIDLSKYYQEYTSPGPVLTFKVNTPTNTSYGTNVPDSFRVQLWWLDPTPENEADTDDDTTTDTTDERIIYQNLDLEEPYPISDIVLNAVGMWDGTEPCMPGMIFWHSLTDENDVARAVVLGPYALENNTTSHVAVPSNYAMDTPGFRDYTYTKGTVGLISTSGGYALFFNLDDNTDYITEGAVATIGKVFDEDMDMLQLLAGNSTSDYDALSAFRPMSNTFLNIPLWNSYTDDEFVLYKQPERSDFEQIVSATISDNTGTLPNHGLKFVEDPAYDSGLDYEDDNTYNNDDEDVPEVDPNSSIKQCFNVSLSEDGIFTYKLRDNIALSNTIVGTYPFFYRVYVNDGTNNGKIGTDFFEGEMYVSIEYPFVIYLGNSYYSSSIDYDESTTAPLWDWFDSSTFGWFLVRGDFPNYRWVDSYEHGWMYLCGDSTDSDEGVFWYNAPLNYNDGSSTYNDDEVGWFWTSTSMFPYIYSFKDGGWVYYIKDEDSDSTDNDEEDDYKERILDKRLFWSYRQKAYITPDGNDTNYGPTSTIRIHGKKFGTGLNQ